MTREEKIRKIANKCKEISDCTTCKLYGYYAVCPVYQYLNGDAELTNWIIERGHEILFKEEKEKKKMTVEELVQVLDKGTRFEIAEVYNGAVIFMSSLWYQSKRNVELWENVKQREVELITAQDTDEVKIFVSLAPPVRKDS